MNWILSLCLLFPKKATINLINETDNSLALKNIIVGIRVSATIKSDLELSPFISDENGSIVIYKSKIEKKAEEAISFGVMDYAPTLIIILHI